MSEYKKVYEILKIYLFYGVNVKDKVNGQQSNAIFIFIYLCFFVYSFVFFVFFKFLMYIDLMTKPPLVPTNGFIKTI